MRKIVQLEHPLRDREISGISSWEQLRRMFDASSTIEEQLNLLHRSSNVGTKQEQVPFWLSLANGYSLPEHQGAYAESERLIREQKRVKLFGSDEPTRDTALPVRAGEPGVRLRASVAKKAWEVLCVHFFKSHSGKFDRWWIEEEQSLLDAVLQFFDPVERWYNIPSWQTTYPDDKSAAAASDFIRKFVSWVHEHDISAQCDSRRGQARLKQLKASGLLVRAATLLVVMGDFQGIRRFFPVSDKKASELLRKVALAGYKPGCHLDLTPRFASIDEAVRNRDHNIAAELYLLFKMQGRLVAERLPGM